MEGLMFSAAFFAFFWQGPPQFLKASRGRLPPSGFSPIVARHCRETGRSEKFGHAGFVRPNAARRHSQIGRRRETKIAPNGLSRKARIDLAISPT
jgi:hypothetical protein